MLSGDGAFGSGRCDRNGCFSRVGGPRSPSHLAKLYGNGKGVDIDSMRPFDVEARVDAEGGLTVSLMQDGTRVVSFDKTMAGVRTVAARKS